MTLLDANASLPRRLDGVAGPGGGETAHGFGDGLVGVLHEGGRNAGDDDARDTAARDTAVILLNAGMVHRIGPHRGSVELARGLAGRGWPVFRYDQSGLGDSPLSRHASVERRLLELRAAMDLVAERTGARRFVVGGICSAADHAFHLANVEPRVGGVLLLDGLAYPTPGFWWRHLLPRIFKPAKLWRWWRSRGAEPDMANFRDWPTRNEATARLAGMVERDVRLLFLFTGGAYRYYNHAGQLAACFGAAVRSPQVSTAYWPECDHTFYLQRDRLRLQDAVAAWLQDQFGTSRTP
jgi:pimeloyl-ACP methyl ester carboxylesterase